MILKLYYCTVYVFFITIGKLDAELWPIMTYIPTDLVRGETYAQFNFLQAITLDIIISPADDADVACYSVIDIEKVNSTLNNNAEELNKCSNNMLQCETYEKSESSSTEIPNLLTCSCYCQRIQDSREETVDSICLDAVYTNIMNGYIVTGARFKILNNILMLQIQEGFLRNGVLVREVHWIMKNHCDTVEKFDVFSRSVFLDDVILPQNMVITGLSLNKCDVNCHKLKKSGHKNIFYLSVYGTPIDENINLTNRSVIPKTYSNESSLGVTTLGRTKHYYYCYYNESMHSENRNKLDLFNLRPLSPKLSPYLRKEGSEPGKQFITFETMKSNISNHLLVPYIDLTETETTPSTPLIGAGLYYKYPVDYIGFLSIKLYIDG